MYFILPERVHDKFHGNNSDFIGSEFVKTCDELVIGYKGCDWSACYFTTNSQRQQKIWCQCRNHSCQICTTKKSFSFLCRRWLCQINQAGLEQNGHYSKAKQTGKLIGVVISFSGKFPVVHFNHVPFWQLKKIVKL